MWIILGPGLLYSKIYPWFFSTLDLHNNRKAFSLEICNLFVKKSSVDPSVRFGFKILQNIWMEAKILYWPLQTITLRYLYCNLKYINWHPVYWRFTYKKPTENTKIESPVKSNLKSRKKYVQNRKTFYDFFEFKIGREKNIEKNQKDFLLSSQILFYLYLCIHFKCLCTTAYGSFDFKIESRELLCNVVGGTRIDFILR